MQQAPTVNGNGTHRDLRLLEGVLSRLPLFRSLATHQIVDLAARAKAIHFRRGASVCVRDRCLPGIYAVAYGQVKLGFRDEAGERVMRVAAAGETFGLAAAILGRPPLYEAVALENSLLVIVSSAAVVQMLENDPRLARAVIVDLAERNMELVAEAEAGALHSGVQRLAAYLEMLAAHDASKASESCTVHLPTTKTVVASLLGIKKETLSRLLRDLAHRGLIEVEQRKIAILDRIGLTALSRDEA